MCGIAGKMIFTREGAVTREVVLAMTGALAHRGPDGSGFHFGRQAGLGHRRMDTAGHGGERQPLGDDTRTVWVTLDGEILNARELRAQLAAVGRLFSTSSDAEVIIRGYQQWGDGVVEHLRGPFALAIWDEPGARLVLARDRLGVKPLCYSVLDGKAIVFGSEVRALLEDPEVPRDWDPVAVREYLALGYVPSPATMFRRLVRLMPGHVLTVEHGRVRVRRYWDVPFGREDRRPEGEQIVRLAESLNETARAYAGGEGGATVLLSSRPWSAALAAALATTQTQPVVTTTVAFDNQPLGEIQASRAIARRLGCRHHIELLTPRLPELVSRLAWYFDEPFGDPAAVTSYYQAAAARVQSRVAYSAAGANEVWGRARHSGPGRWFGPLLSGSSATRPGTAFRWRIRALCSTDLLRDTAGADPLFSLRSVRMTCPATDRRSRALYTDIKTRLADNVLTKIDRMSAAADLRMRLPLIDHSMIELAASIPARLRARGAGSQYLFQRLLDGRVPPALFATAGHPFEAQPAAWLRGPLASMTSDVLLAGRFRQRGLFDPKAVTAVWQAHLTGRRDCHRELWSLLMLELWFERVVDGGQRRLRAA